MFASKDILLAAPSGYKISRSVRLRSSASAYFDRTPASATNRKTWTWSGWVKRGKISTDIQPLFVAATLLNASANRLQIDFQADDTLRIGSFVSSTGTVLRVTTQVFRDTSAWYHLIIAFDTTQATANNRLKVYVNGNEITAFSTTNNLALNADSFVNNNIPHAIGIQAAASPTYLDGYLTEVNFIDGQALTPSSFGEINPITGVWQPKQYTGTYGTNGFELNFSDNSAATAAAIGKDYSGNGNNWTPNNISVTAGATYDSMLDVPTPYADGGNGRGNYATLNPLDTVTALQASLASGNLELNANTTSGASGNSRATIAVNSGKWYFEATLSGYVGSSNLRAGWDTAVAGVGTGSSGITGAYKEISSNQTVIIAVDLNNLLAWVGSNGTWDAGDPSVGTGGTSISLSGYLAVPFVRDNSGTAGNGGKWTVNFGQRPFAYTPPTGFLSLNTQNLPDATISNGAAYMADTTYTGTNTTLAVSNAVNGISFQPDFVWVKGRSGATDHAWYDAVRGVQKQIESNSDGAETTETTGLTAFGSTGFTIGALAQMNTNAATYVGWQWNAGGSTVTNTSGSISAQVRANTTAGFSVVTYTGTGANATVGHGLGVAPSWVICKRRNSTGGWPIFVKALNNNAQYMTLNNTDAANTDSTVFNNTAPTSTVFSLGTDTFANTNTGTYVAYCFAPVAGYSAFGSYTGNGSTDGPFVFLGFRPRFVMLKRTDVADEWAMHDSARPGYNATNLRLIANSSGAELATQSIDLTSNGFKIRSTSSSHNASGGTYIYMAFAENPFKLSLAR
jgi:hypothetical protein